MRCTHDRSSVGNTTREQQQRRQHGPGQLRSWAAVLMLSFGLGCAAKPVPDPPPAPVIAPPPPPIQPPPPPPPPPAPVIVVNQSDLFGQLEAKQGALVTIRALLVLSKNRPATGSKGMLACAPAQASSESDWLPLGEVEVKRPLDESSRIQVRLLEGDKPLVVPGQKKPGQIPKNTRLRLRWEY